MRMTQLGNSNLRISALGLGCMGMSEFYGTSDDTKSLAVIDHAFDLGINFFDTADMYGHGHNERLLSEFINKNKGKRDALVIATKFGIKREQVGVYAREIDNSSAYMRACCEASLSRLGIDVIDLYYVHRLASDRPIEDVTADLARLVEEGKIRHIGFSEISADQLRRASRIHPVSAVQTEYSLVTRDTERNGVQDACREVGASFVAYSPLGRGFLTASQTSTDDFEENDFRRMNPRFQADAMAHNLRLLDTVKAMAAEKNVTPAQVTLAWVLNKNSNVVPIPGTRHERYLEQNVAALDIVLTPEDMQRLETTFHYEAVLGQRYPEEGLKGLSNS